MKLRDISLNLYSFGYYGGFIKDLQRSGGVLDINGLVALAEEHGLGGVEIPFDHFYSLDQIPDGIAVLESIRSRGMSVFLDMETLDLDYMDVLLPYMPSLGIEVVRIKMDQIGTTIYGGNRYASPTFDQAVAGFRIQLHSLLPALEKNKVAVAIENHQDFHSSELAALASDVSEEFVGITWDVGNSASVADSPASFYDTAGHLIRNVHLKDYRLYHSEKGVRLTRCPLGQGYVDFKDVFDRLSSNGKVVNMSIELGAQITRECDIENAGYWDEYSGADIDEAAYLGFLNQNRCEQGESLSDYEQGVRGKALIDRELSDVAASVDYLKQLFA